MTAHPATGAVSAAERRERLRLARSENVGPVAFRYLIETYGEEIVRVVDKSA